MARDELTTGNIWEGYSQKIQDRINNPVAMGELTQEDANKENARLIVAEFGNESSGNAIKLFWLVDESTDTIINSKFKSFGNGLIIASSDAMTELCIGKKVNDVVYITETEVEAFLRDNAESPAIPVENQDSFIIGNEVIIEAAAQYKGISKNDIVTSDIVCDCTQKSRKEIIDVIKENDIAAVEDIIRKTAAGAYCKSCVRPGGQVPKDVYLIDILEEVKETMKKEEKEAINDNDASSLENTTQSNTNSFDKMTVDERIKAVDAIIDEFIRPMLVMDGGDMEIIDIKENIPHYDIYIRYLGACGSCASGTTGTLYAIETTLQQKIDENIRVLPV